MRNIFVYTSVFFCEKFIIEHITKVSIEKFISGLRSLLRGREFFFSSGLSQLILLLLYILIILEFFFFLLIK